MAVILDLSGTLPQTFTEGNWPRTHLNTGKWHFQWTPTAASTDAAWGTGFYAMFASSGTPSGTDNGGLWITSDKLELYNQASTAVISQALAWAAGATIDITIDIPLGQVTIAGASSGNGTFSFTPSGTYFTAGTLGCGVYGGGGFSLPASVLGDIDDTQAATPSVASWAPRVVDRVPRRAGPIAALIAAAWVGPIAPPSAPPDSPPLAWAPEFPDRVPAARRPVNQGGSFAPAPLPIPNASAPLLSWAAEHPDRVPGPRRPVNAGGSFAPAPLPLANAAAPALSWAPEFPDILRPARRNPPGGLVAPPYDTSSPAPAPALSWAPEFPDMALPRPRRPFGGLTAPPYDTSSPAPAALTIGKAIISQRINALSPPTGTLTTPGTDIAVTAVANATDTLTAVGHGMTTGDGPYKPAVSGGTLPGGLDSSTRYYVIRTGADTFKLATTVQLAIAGTAVNLTDDGSGTISLVRHVDTQASGSAFLAFVSRGQWSSAPTGPTDNKGNVYTAVAGPRAYDGFPGSQAGVYADLTGVGGAAHTWSLDWANFDEITIGALEVVGATVCNVSSFTEVAIGSTTVQGPAVDATAGALLVAVVFGNGPVSQDHTFTFLDGFTKIPECTAEGDISANGYIQHAVAYKRVYTRGRYSFRVQGVNQEGGQLVILALQSTSNEVPPMDWNVQAAHVFRREQRPTGGVVGPLVTPAPSIQQWQPSYPDQHERPARAIAQAVAAAPSDTNAGPLTWGPTFPDQVRRAAQRLLGGHVAPPSDTNAGPLTWAPTYPSQVRGASPRTRGGEVAPPPDRNAGPLTWAPVYPAQVPLVARRPLGAATAPVTVPAPPPPAPPLSWAPSYPDAVPPAAAALILGGAVAPAAVLPNPPSPIPETVVIVFDDGAIAVELGDAAPNVALGDPTLQVTS